VQDRLAERGIVVSHEAIRQWCTKFGPAYAAELRRRRARPGDKWYLDEVLLDPPALFVEHFPDTGCRLDELATKHFDQVALLPPRRSARFWNARRGMAQRFGEPDWRRGLLLYPAVLTESAVTTCSRCFDNATSAASGSAD
jgi:hypothetical protein